MLRYRIPVILKEGSAKDEVRIRCTQESELDQYTEKERRSNFEKVEAHELQSHRNQFSFFSSLLKADKNGEGLTIMYQLAKANHCETN